MPAAVSTRSCCVTTWRTLGRPAAARPVRALTCGKPSDACHGLRSGAMRRVHAADALRAGDDGQCPGIAYNAQSTVDGCTRRRAGLRSHVCGVAVQFATVGTEQLLPMRGQGCAVPQRALPRLRPFPVEHTRMLGRQATAAPGNGGVPVVAPRTHSLVPSRCVPPVADRLAAHPMLDVRAGAGAFAAAVMRQRHHTRVDGGAGGRECMHSRRHTSRAPGSRASP
jgi:hypothetical protein